MASGTIVLDKKHRFGSVILLESSDELHGSPIEGVYVLIIITDCKKSEFAVLILYSSSSEGGYQLVLIFADVLVFINQDPSETRENTVSLIVRFFLLKTLPVQQCYRLAQHFFEFNIVEWLPPSLLKAYPDYPHGKSVARKYGYTASVVSNQFRQTPSDLNGRVSIVCQGKYSTWIFTPHPQEVGDSMHQYACLTRSGTRQYKHVYLFTVIGDYPLLDGILQALYNCLPRFRCGLTLDFLFTIGQPTTEEIALFQAEIVHGQSQRLGHVLKPALREFSHHMNLTYLSGVVKIERFEVHLRKTSSVFRQFDGHGRTKDRKALVKANDILFMQPEKCAVQKFLRLLAIKKKIGCYRGQQLPQGSFD